MGAEFELHEGVIFFRGERVLAIADTKAAIYDALAADGVAVINADDAFAPYFAERAHGRAAS